MFDPSDANNDEPFFTLLGRDPAAPHIIRAWAWRRCGRPQFAREEAAKAERITVVVEPQSSNDPQIVSAFRLADKMERYFKAQALEQGRTGK